MFATCFNSELRFSVSYTNSGKKGEFSVTPITLCYVQITVNTLFNCYLQVKILNDNTLKFAKHVSTETSVIFS